MLRPRLSLAILIMGVTFAVPSTARAGMLDIIWGMSGPRMVGVGAFCRITYQGEIVTCKITGRKEHPRVWLTGETAFYFSVGDKNGFDFGDAFMVTADPMVEWRWLAKPFMVYSGAGATYNVLFGPDFDTFDNLGVKIRPIAAEWSGFVIRGLQYNVRFYGDEFGRDLFGRARPVRGDRPREVIHTVSFVLPF